MAFIDTEYLQKTDAAQDLIKNCVPSRIGQKDATVFDFDAEVAEYASRRLGWTTLAAEPPIDPSEIAVIAQQARCEGLDAVVLIGQGGSAQASQTITKLHSLEVTDEIPFRTMDSMSPVYVNHILGSSDPARTLYIVSSKSGTTLEPTVLSHVAWKYACAMIGEEAAGKRFIAITDRNTDLEQVARKNGWRMVLKGSPDVGGRYSALTVFGLLPMACVGLDVEKALRIAVPTEELCHADSPDNPALQLAAFLYDNYCAGRDKFALLMPPATQVFGLWVEQIVAESLGKGGVGILPNVEIDAGILSDPHKDTCAILCNMGNNEAFEHAKACIHPDIPVLRLDILDTGDMTRHFLIWEYAVAFCGYLMKVNPFDQPDVESTKQATRQILYGQGGGFSVPDDNSGRPAYQEFDVDELGCVDEVYVSTALLDEFSSSYGTVTYDEDSSIADVDLDSALRMLFASIRPGDYFSYNAFLPFRGIGRRETLERVRHRVANRLGVRSCLEIGPRYLHSTGQLHKGGANNGVFLVVSSDEACDIAIPHEDFTLGAVENAEALGDFSALAARGRRCVYVHLKDNDSECLAQLADSCCSAISAAYARRIEA